MGVPRNRSDRRAGADVNRVLPLTNNRVDDHLKSVSLDIPTAASLFYFAVVAILLVSALSFAARQVFSVALYRYATGASDTRGFDVADLEEPFRRRG